MTDIVITWVDGNDPHHLEKRQHYLSGKQENLQKDVAGAERYDSSGEIYFCIASILRFATFVRKIFLVTDQQQPPLEKFLETNFPDNTIPIETVDHRTLFRDYEEYLPTFCSRSIETMLFRIPDLNEQFVYFNDDLFLTSPIRETTWFEDGKAVYYAKRFSCRTVRCLSALRTLIKGRKIVGYKDGMANAAKAVGSGYFWLTRHTPMPLLKSVLENFYADHVALLKKNIGYRFRNGEQYNPQALFSLLAEQENKYLVRPPAGTTLFLKPSKQEEGYIRKRVGKADRNPGLLFGCINSLGSATEKDRRDFQEWICAKLNIVLNA